MSSSTMSRPPSSGASPQPARDQGGVFVDRVTRHDGPLPGLTGYAVDFPGPDSRSPGYGLNVQGWVLGADGPVDNVELRCRGVPVGTMAVDAPRPDLGTAHPGHEWASRAGFRGRLNTMRLPADFELHLTVHAGGTRSAVATVHGRRTVPCEVGRNLVQPVVLTTLGRSGSTWVTRLLGQHPAVSAYRPFVYEPRAAAYWYTILADLTEPTSYGQLLGAQSHGRGWWIGPETAHLPAPHSEPMVDWLGRSQVDALLPLCVERVEAFYRESARIQGKPRITHFVEKFLVKTFLPPFVHDLYPGAAEVILVRDFRDMLVSMLDFNRKRDTLGFGRDQVSSDEEFIRWWRGGAMALLEEWRARSDTAFLLRYEELILRPADTLTSVLDFIGVDARSETVEAVIERSLSEMTAAQRFHMTSGDAVSSVGRWARELPPTLRRAASETFDDLLSELGYET